MQDGVTGRNLDGGWFDAGGTQKQLGQKFFFSSKQVFSL